MRVGVVGAGADLYKARQRFEEAVRVGRSNSAIKWYRDSCASTVEKKIWKVAAAGTGSGETDGCD